MITCFSRESFCNRGIVFCARLVKDNFVQMQLFNSTRLYLSLVVHLRCVFLCSTLTRGNKHFKFLFSRVQTWELEQFQSLRVEFATIAVENLTTSQGLQFLRLASRVGLQSHKSNYRNLRVNSAWAKQCTKRLPAAVPPRSSLPAAVTVFLSEFPEQKQQIAVWSRWRRAVTRSSETIEGAKGTPELHSDDTKQKHFLSVFPEQKQQKVTVKGAFLSIEIHEQNTECNWGGKRNSAKCIQVNNYKTQSKNTVWSRRVVPEHWNSWAKHRVQSHKVFWDNWGGKRDSQQNCIQVKTQSKNTAWSRTWALKFMSKTQRVQSHKVFWDNWGGQKGLQQNCIQVNYKTETK